MNASEGKLLDGVGNATTEHSPADVQAYSRSIGWILLPLTAMGALCLLILFVHYGLKKHRLDQLRHHLVPMYSFDAAEGDDWEADVPDLVDPKQLKQNPRYQAIDGGMAGVGSSGIGSRDSPST